MRDSLKTVVLLSLGIALLSGSAFCDQKQNEDWVFDHPFRGPVVANTQQLLQAPEGSIFLNKGYTETETPDGVLISTDTSPKVSQPKPGFLGIAFGFAKGFVQSVDPRFTPNQGSGDEDFGSLVIVEEEINPITGKRVKIPEHTQQSSLSRFSGTLVNEIAANELIRRFSGPIVGTAAAATVGVLAAPLVVSGLVSATTTFGLATTAGYGAAFITDQLPTVKGMAERRLYKLSDEVLPMLPKTGPEKLLSFTQSGLRSAWSLFF